MSDLFAAFPQFTELQRQRFRDCVSRLLAGHVVAPGSAISPDHDWQFLDHNSEIVAQYLELGGWRLEMDRRLGVARVLHERGEQRVHLPKLESLMFCALRLFYHEQRLHLHEDDRCQISVGELRERLIHSGAASSAVSRAKLRDGVKMLARYHLVVAERGFAGEDDETIVVNEVVEKVLSAERIQQYVDSFSEIDEAPADTLNTEDEGGDAPAQA